MAKSKQPRDMDCACVILPMSLPAITTKRIKLRAPMEPMYPSSVKVAPRDVALKGTPRRTRPNSAPMENGRMTGEIRDRFIGFIQGLARNFFRAGVNWFGRHCMGVCPQELMMTSRASGIPFWKI